MLKIWLKDNISILLNKMELNLKTIVGQQITLLVLYKYIFSNYNFILTKLGVGTYGEGFT